MKNTETRYVIKTLKLLIDIFVLTLSELVFGINPRSVTEGIILNELQDDINRIDLSLIREKGKTRLDNDQNQQKIRFDCKRQ